MYAEILTYRQMDLESLRIHQKASNTSKGIKRYQKASEGIKRHQKASKGIKRHQKASKGIKRLQKPSKAIKYHQKPSKDIKMHQKASNDIKRHQKVSTGIKRHQNTKKKPIKRHQVTERPAAKNGHIWQQTWKYLYKDLIQVRYKGFMSRSKEVLDSVSSQQCRLLLWLITLHATSSANDWVGGHNNNGFGIFMQCFLMCRLNVFWLQSYQTNIWDVIIYHPMRSVSTRLIGAQCWCNSLH